MRLFKASSATGIFEGSFPGHQILDAIFVPHKSVEETDINWQKKSQLYFMNKQQVSKSSAHSNFVRLLQNIKYGKCWFVKEYCFLQS